MSPSKRLPYRAERVMLQTTCLSNLLAVSRSRGSIRIAHAALLEGGLPKPLLGVSQPLLRPDEQKVVTLNGKPANASERFAHTQGQSCLCPFSIRNLDPMPRTKLETQGIRCHCRANMEPA